MLSAVPLVSAMPVAATHADRNVDGAATAACRPDTGRFEPSGSRIRLLRHQCRRRAHPRTIAVAAIAGRCAERGRRWTSMLWPRNGSCGGAKCASTRGMGADRDDSHHRSDGPQRGHDRLPSADCMPSCRRYAADGARRMTDGALSMIGGQAVGCPTAGWLDRQYLRGVVLALVPVFVGAVVVVAVVVVPAIMTRRFPPHTRACAAALRRSALRRPSHRRRLPRQAPRCSCLP